MDLEAVKRLMSDRDHHGIHGADAHLVTLSSLADEVPGLVAEVEKLNTALLRFGRHSPDCRWQQYGTFPKPECDCGWTQARNAVPEDRRQKGEDSERLNGAYGRLYDAALRYRRARADNADGSMASEIVRAWEELTDAIAFVTVEREKSGKAGCVHEWKSTEPVLHHGEQCSKCFEIRPAAAAKGKEWCRTPDNSGHRCVLDAGHKDDHFFA